MRKTIKLIAFVLLLIQANVIHAQKFRKSDEPFTAANGKTYNVGDTIILCAPADFGNTFHHYYLGKNLNPLRAYYTNEVVSKGQQTDLRFKKQVIRQFRIYEDQRTMAVTDKMFGYSIDLNKALNSGEVATPKYEEFIYRTSELFEPKLAYISALKLTGNIDKNSAKEYAYRYYRKEYKQKYQDEFELHSFLNDKKKELTKKVEEFNSDKLYMLPVNQSFGSYDFDLGAFPIEWDGNMKSFLNDATENLIVKDINEEGIDLMDLSIFFENTEEFKSFPLEQTKAKYLIDKRKASSGKVNRKLYACVQFKIKSLAGPDFYEQYDISDKTKKFLLCEIKRVDLFEDDTLTYHYLNTLEK